MIFKRKEAKPAGIGSICSIKPAVSSKMKLTEEYLSKSVVKWAQDNGTYIRKQFLQKGRPKNKVMLADAKLVYILEDSLFNGIVKVIPLAIYDDAAVGYGVRALTHSGQTFLMHRESLTLASQGTIDEISGSYYQSVRDSLSYEITRLKGSQFSWNCNQFN